VCAGYPDEAYRVCQIQTKVETVMFQKLLDQSVKAPQGNLAMLTDAYRLVFHSDLMPGRRPGGDSAGRVDAN
jgi:hypothetical protein